MEVGCFLTTLEQNGDLFEPPFLHPNVFPSKSWSLFSNSVRKFRAWRNFSKSTSQASTRVNSPDFLLRCLVHPFFLIRSCSPLNRTKYLYRVNILWKVDLIRNWIIVGSWKSLMLSWIKMLDIRTSKIQPWSYLIDPTIKKRGKFISWYVLQINYIYMPGDLSLTWATVTQDLDGPFYILFWAPEPIR